MKLVICTRDTLKSNHEGVNIVSLLYSVHAVKIALFPGEPNVIRQILSGRTEVR